MLAARDLLNSTTDKRAKSWMLSRSLPGSGHWLHTLPTVHLLEYFQSLRTFFVRCCALGLMPQCLQLSTSGNDNVYVA